MREDDVMECVDVRGNSCIGGGGAADVLWEQRC